MSEIDKLDDERQQLRIEQSKSLDQLNETKIKLQKVRTNYKIYARSGTV